MHHAMAESDKALGVQRTIRYRRQRFQRGRVIDRGYFLVMHRRAVGSRDRQMSFAADAFDLAAQAAPHTARLHLINREFQAGGAGVQNANTTMVHDSWPFASGACMLRSNHRRALETAMTKFGLAQS